MNRLLYRAEIRGELKQNEQYLMLLMQYREILLLLLLLCT